MKVRPQAKHQRNSRVDCGSLALGSSMSYSSVQSLAVRVYYEDTDFSGRIYHASYVRFLERGRTELLRHLGFAHREIAEKSALSFVVRRLQIEFLAPAVVDDLLDVDTRFATVRGTSLGCLQRILRGRLELVTANVLVASVRGDKPTRVPADLGDFPLSVEIVGAVGAHEIYAASSL